MEKDFCNGLLRQAIAVSGHEMRYVFVECSRLYKYSAAGLFALEADSTDNLVYGTRPPLKYSEYPSIFTSDNVTPTQGYHIDLVGNGASP